MRIVIGERDRLRSRGGRKRRRVHGPGKALSSQISGDYPVVPDSCVRRLGFFRRRRCLPDRGTRNTIRTRPYLEIVPKTVAEPSHPVRGCTAIAARYRRPGTPVRGARELPAHLVSCRLFVAVQIPGRTPGQNHAEIPRRGLEGTRRRFLTPVLLVVAGILGERLRRGREHSRRQNHDQQKRVRRKAGKSRARSRTRLGGGYHVGDPRIQDCPFSRRYRSGRTPAGTLRLPPQPYQERLTGRQDPLPEKSAEPVYAGHPENRLPRTVKTTSALREPEIPQPATNIELYTERHPSCNPEARARTWALRAFSRPFSRKAA